MSQRRFNPLVQKVKVDFSMPASPQNQIKPHRLKGRCECNQTGCVGCRTMPDPLTTSEVSPFMVRAEKIVSRGSKYPILLRFQIATTVKRMALGTRSLKHWLLGPSGVEMLRIPFLATLLCSRRTRRLPTIRDSDTLISPPT